MALPRANRLSLRLNRERLTKVGKTSHGQFFTLISAPTEGTYPRLAILLSKKTSPLAVNRNKIKRLTSAVLEGLLSILPPKDYLVIPQRQVLETSQKDLQTDILSLLKK